MRSVPVIAAVSAVLCAAAPAARADAPRATVSGSGIDVAALLSSGEEFCSDHALFADGGWPPVGLERTVPATAGQTVRIVFDHPATLRQADVIGVAAPAVGRPVASMTPDGPAAWRVTLPAAPDPAGLALRFGVDWADGGCPGDQLYPVGLGAPPEGGHATAGRGGR